MAKVDQSAGVGDAVNEKNPTSTAKRKIPGNLPYLTSSGTIKTVLERIIEAQQPPRFNADFLENVLNIKGGAARATIPIMKKMGFLTSEGVPTELYAKFRTNSGRGNAALQGLQAAFSEIFRKSSYAHTANDAKLKDLIVEITGLTPNDPVATAIRGTFNSIKSFVPPDVSLDPAKSESEKVDDSADAERNRNNSEVDIDNRKNGNNLSLAYNINIVLPETSDLNVLNAIFRSIKENLMR